MEAVLGAPGVVGVAGAAVGVDGGCVCVDPLIALN